MKAGAKIWVITFLAVTLGYGGWVAFRFIRTMNESFEFAQQQARLGRSYMDSMQQADYLEVMNFSRALMAEPPSASGGVRSLSNFEERKVPETWRAKGIIFIRYGPKRVTFGWHGGPHAHTCLDVDRLADGSIAFTAHYSDHVPDKRLKVIAQAEQD